MFGCCTFAKEKTFYRMCNDIKMRLKAVSDGISEGVRLVAVSKYHPAEQICEAYDAGQRVFGESHVQELLLKKDCALLADKKDLQWHFIGHLQRNKVKHIVPFIELIHSVDSLKLLEEIDRQAEKCNRTVDILLELHIAEEESKYGLSIDECRKMLEDGKWRTLTHVHICGIMMMASNTDDEEQIRQEFMMASDFYTELKNKFFREDDGFCIRSWGMSDDYRIALECNSNMIRVGTKIFGNRI